MVAFLGEPSESIVAVSTAKTVQKAIAKSAELRKKTKAKSTSGSPKKKRGRPPKKSNIVEEEATEETEDVSDDSEKKETEPEDNDEDEVIEGKTIPSAKKLRTWVKAYVACFDLDKCSAKHAIGTASDKFKVDLSIKKNTIMEMLKDEISL